MRPLFRLAYRKPALAIRTAPQNPEDGLCSVQCAQWSCPTASTDVRGTVPERTAAEGERLIILFTGVLIPSKGVTDLLEAFNAVCGQRASTPNCN